MRYDKRATVIQVLPVKTPLGIEEQETPVILPCAKQNISLEETATIYGGELKESVKLHFQQVIREAEYVFFNGTRYDVISSKPFKRATVLYLEKSGHYVQSN